MSRPVWRVGEDEQHLGERKGKQRGKYNTGALPVEKQRRLESLPDWSWAAREDRWEESFAQLRDYVAENGTALVPNACVWKGFPLGSWINKQRTMYDRGKSTRSSTSPRGAARLVLGCQRVPVGAGVQVPDRVRRRARLRAGAGGVSGGRLQPRQVGLQRADEPSQRCAGTGTRSAAGSSSRVELVSASDKWEKFYAALAEYAELTGTSEVSSKLTVKGLSLGAWAETSAA